MCIHQHEWGYACIYILFTGYDKCIIFKDKNINIYFHKNKFSKPGSWLWVGDCLKSEDNLTKHTPQKVVYNSVENIYIIISVNLKGRMTSMCMHVCYMYVLYCSSVIFIAKFNLLMHSLACCGHCFCSVYFLLVKWNKLESIRQKITSNWNQRELNMLSTCK